MVDEITPTYYASGVEQPSYTLTGSGFDWLPSDALGIRATSNDNPLEFINSGSLSLYDITEKSDTRIVLARQGGVGPIGSRGYLGAIVSNDRNIIYWVNDSQPLPL